MPHGSIRVGQVEITALCDVVGEHPEPLREAFPRVPAEAWAPYRRRYPEVFRDDRWILHVHCFLVRWAAPVVLVDAGVGGAGAPGAGWIGSPGRLPDELAAVDVSPDDVDLVVVTHLHFDHYGWAVRAGGEAVSPSFPRARYLVPRVDWDLLEREPTEAFESHLLPLKGLGALDLVEGERDVTQELRLIPTPGHTPGSQSIVVSSGRERAILWGDVASHPAQVSEPGWWYTGDGDAELAGSTRREVISRAEREGMIVATAHVPEPFGRVAREDGERRWAPQPTGS